MQQSLDHKGVSPHQVYMCPSGLVRCVSGLTEFAEFLFKIKYFIESFKHICSCAVVLLL